MSFIEDHVHKIDTLLDRVQLQHAPTLYLTSVESPSTTPSLQAESSTEHDYFNKIKQLRSCVRAVSVVRASRTQSALGSVLLNLEKSFSSGAQKPKFAEEEDLEWLLISKATVQVYRFILTLLLTQTLQIERDIRYWDDVLRSDLYSGLYSIQVAPRRAWEWSKNICVDAASKTSGADAQSLSIGWREFYSHVRCSVRTRFISTIRATAISPLIMFRGEIHRKRDSLRQFREIKAVSLGILMNDALSFNFADEASAFSVISEEDSGSEDWKGILVRSIALMEAVLRQGQVEKQSAIGFEDSVFSELDNNASSNEKDDYLTKCCHLSERLCVVMRLSIPRHISVSRQFLKLHGHPSPIVRYWIPATILLLSSTTLLRVCLGRKAQIYAWIADVGETVLDFWTNWILEPCKKIMGIIRHDEDSELALMSKSSLKGDRESLERMVVDFARDNNSTLTQLQLQDVSNKVQEGDLTPVLKAYESDIRRPFIGTVRGDLIRALLIQVQKTKVDIEVAIGGIDALLKSQELVFGFIGVTPGIMVCIATLRWISGISSRRKSLDWSKRRSRRSLRKIDEILNDAEVAPSADSDSLSNRQRGLLLCESQLLRQNAAPLIPNDLLKDFLEDMDQLLKDRSGVQHQNRVLDRIRWTYGSDWF